MDEFGSIRNEITLLVNGLNFDLLNGFYLSSTQGDFSLMEYYDFFQTSSYGMHMVSSYPPFYGLELEYTVLDKNFAIVHLRELSAFNNGALVAVNSGGYYVRELYGTF